MKSVVLWTGGKDCVLAMKKALDLGFEVVELVTFIPKDPDFKAHPLHVIQKQAESIGLPHQLVEIGKPFNKSYELAIQSLIDRGIECLITGDIDLVLGYPNWIDERCENLKINVFKPLWKQNRMDILNDLLAFGFDLIFSAVKCDIFDPSWIGRKINHDAIADLNLLSCDLCGENGEYHSIVVDCSLFSKPINLKIIEKVKFRDLYCANFSVLA